MTFNKKLVLIGLLTLILMPATNALQVSPSSISETASPDDFKMVTLDITNDANSSQQVTINSNKDWIMPGVSSIEIDASETATINTFLNAPSTGGTYSGNLVAVGDETKAIGVSLDVSSQTEGHLEPTFSHLILTLTEGVTETRTISVRNLYNKKVEVVDLNIQGAISTEQGKKPISISAGELGFLNPGKDLTFTTNLNTVDLDAKTYTPTLKLVYYDPSGSRQTVDISFEVKVTEKLKGGTTEKLKTMEMSYSPSTPKPGDTMSVTLKDGAETIQGDVEVTVTDPSTGEKITSYTYASPFKMSSNKYCLNATKEGYKSVSDCFVAEDLSSTIEMSPSEPEINDSVMVKLTDPDGNIITQGSLIIDGEHVPAPQATRSFGSGNYKIVGYADGYTNATKTFTLELPLEYNIQGGENLGDNLSLGFNQKASWRVYHTSPQGTRSVYDEGRSQTVSVTLDDPGNYTVFAQNKELQEFSFAEKSLLPSVPVFGFVSDNWFWVLVIFGGLVLFYFRKPLLSKRRKKRSLGYDPVAQKESGPVVKKEGR